MKKSHRHLLIVFLFGALLRLVLLALYPVPYGNDGFGRLYFSDRIFLSHWLPLTQSIVYSAAGLGLSPQMIRVVFAVLASLAGCGFYLLLRRLVTSTTTLLGALVFSANALMIILSLMPYQDVLFVGLLCAALAVLSDPKRPMRGAAGSILFGLACLTRYESWFLIPILITMRATAIPGRDSPRGTAIPGRDSAAFLPTLARSVFYFCWAPLFWLLLSSIHFGSWDGFLYQTAHGDFYAWDPGLDLAWSWRYAGRMLYWLGLFGSPLLLLGLVGFLSVPEKYRQNPRLLTLLGILVILVLGFFFFVMDRAQDTVFRFAMIPLTLALILTVLGLERLTEKLRFHLPPAARTSIALLLLALLVLYAAIPVARLNRDSQYTAPYRVARFLESNLEENERVLVIADRSSGLDDAAPLPYQRIVAQFEGDRSRIISAGNLTLTAAEELSRFARQSKIRWIVIFENFKPRLAADRFFADLLRDSQGNVELIEAHYPASVYRVAEYPRQ